MVTAARPGFENLQGCLSAGLGSGHGKHDVADLPLERLNSLERRVANAAIAGATNREIAESLCYSLKSVEAYLTRIYRRLSVDGRAGLVELASRHA